MRIIKNRRIIDSPWQLELDPSGNPLGNPLDNPSPTLSSTQETCPKLISVPQWLEAGDEVKGSGDLGVYLQPTDEVSSIANDLDGIPIIAIVFASFSEGRGYSQATELRQQHHYQGEIRAIGAAVDNLSFMERCGINAFQLDSDDDLEQALSFFTDIETPYN